MRSATLCLSLLVAGCGASAPPSTTPSETSGAGGSAGQASHAATGTCPPEGSTCTTYGAQCRAPGLVCVCTSPCSGAEPETPPPPSWACVRRAPGCPETPPDDGTQCPTPGLGCQWGTCGGTSAECSPGSRWVVREIAPPP